MLAGAGGRCPRRGGGLPGTAGPSGRPPLRPAPSAARCCPGAAVAAVAVAGEGACVCARPEPLQHLCIKMCSSLFQALLTGWLQSSANALRGPGDGFLLPPSHPLPTPSLRPHWLLCSSLYPSGTLLPHGLCRSGLRSLSRMLFSCESAAPSPTVILTLGFSDLL